MSSNTLGPRSVRSGYWYRWPLQAILLIVTSPIRFIVMMICIEILDVFYDQYLNQYSFGFLSPGSLIAPFLIILIFDNVFKADLGEKHQSDMYSASGVGVSAFLVYLAITSLSSFVLVKFTDLDPHYSLSSNITLFLLFMQSSVTKYPLSIMSGGSPKAIRRIAEYGSRMNISGLVYFCPLVTLFVLYLSTCFSYLSFTTSALCVFTTTFWYIAYRDVFDHEERTHKSTLNERIITSFGCHHPK